VANKGNLKKDKGKRHLDRYLQESRRKGNAINQMYLRIYLSTYPLLPVCKYQTIVMVMRGLIIRDTRFDSLAN